MEPVKVNCFAVEGDYVLFEHDHGGLMITCLAFDARADICVDNQDDIRKLRDFLNEVLGE
jgi:hypothetical protein